MFFVVVSVHVVAHVYQSIYVFVGKEIDRYIDIQICTQILIYIPTLWYMERERERERWGGSEERYANIHVYAYILYVIWRERVEERYTTNTCTPIHIMHY